MSSSQAVFSRCACPTLGRPAARRSFLGLWTARSATSSINSLLPQLRRTLSAGSYSSFTDKLADPANKLQSYISRSDDPSLNLSIEDHILRKSSGRQHGSISNPWTEVNLGILNAARGEHDVKDSEPPAIGTVDLVRRRSGGGTVFAIERGQPQLEHYIMRRWWSRALRRLGIDRARVNERHDIVLDQGHEKHTADPQDTHRTPYATDQGGPRPLKVSGSAYKLTRQRALHHATTLLSSPNLHIISDYLRSPAKNFIQAQGVESVSSAASNIGLEVRNHSSDIYKTSLPVNSLTFEDGRVDDGLRTTHALILCSTKEDDIGLQMEVHHGVIKSLEFEGLDLPDNARTALRTALVGMKLQHVWNSNMFRQISDQTQNDQLAIAARRLKALLPVPSLLKR
ncbi:unnamed protein product [Alternaria alternata]